ncbi:MAG: thioredoxin family protein [Patescibacteria group bacterium]
MKYLIGIVILAILGVGIYSTSNKENEVAAPGPAPAEEISEEEESTPTETPTQGSPTEPGSYEPYSPEKLARAESGDVVLFFRASWCPTCRALDANIRTNSGSIPGAVTVLDVDYDNSTELKQKYGVTYQHTLVQVDASGNLIAKWQGSPTLSDLVSKIR